MSDYAAGYVHEVGPNVTRFQKDDRVLSMTSFALRGDNRYGAHQRFVLTSEIHTAHVSRSQILCEPLFLTFKIGSTPFESATSAISVYAAMSALVLHMNLDRPLPETVLKNQSVLIWGGASTLGFYAVQIASQVNSSLKTSFMNLVLTGK